MRPWIAIGAVLVVAGTLLLLASDSTAVNAAGYAAGGAGGILLVGLVFYAVGRSEDRAREAERTERERRS